MQTEKRKGEIIMENKKMGFGTKAIHAGNVKDKMYGALTMPIYQSSTFVFDDCAQGGKIGLAAAQNPAAGAVKTATS